MIEIDITPDMLSAAKAKATEMGTLNRSITGGEGNMAGFLGEQVALSVIGGEWCNTYEYDLIMEDGTKVDVKTKRTSVKPKDYYDCSIAKLNTKQECDRYDFVRISNDLSVAWYLGWKGKQEYFDEARFLQKGDTDGDNGFVVKSDCYNIAIKDLN